MMRRRPLVIAALLGTALAGSAWAQDDSHARQVYIERLPCGGMDCSYTPEQQERMRRSEELQRLMTRFASDLYDGSSTQGWGTSYENLDGNIAILERNLGNLQQLATTARRIDSLWAQLNGDSRGPASLERLQSFIDSTSQMLEREREIREVYKNSRELTLSIGPAAGGAAPQTRASRDATATPAPTPPANRRSRRAGTDEQWSKRVPAYFFCFAHYSAQRSDLYISEIGIWHAWYAYGEAEIERRLRAEYRGQMNRLGELAGILPSSGCNIVWHTSDTPDYASALAEVERRRNFQLDGAETSRSITVRPVEGWGSDRGRLEAY